MKRSSAPALPRVGPYTIPRDSQHAGRIARHLAWCERLHRQRLSGGDTRDGASRVVTAAAQRRLGLPEAVCLATVLASVGLAFALVSVEVLADAAALVAQAGRGLATLIA